MHSRWSLILPTSTTNENNATVTAMIEAGNSGTASVPVPLLSVFCHGTRHTVNVHPSPVCV